MKETTYETAYSEEEDMTFIMKCEYFEGYRISRECVGWYHGAENVKNTREYIGKLKAEYSDLTESIELYFAIINILDHIGKRDIEIDDTLLNIVYTLAAKGKVDLREFTYANECGKCDTWKEVAEAFRDLWKRGERI